MDTVLARLQRDPPPLDGSFADSLLAGLAKTPKEIACKYFYDDAGSRLFDRICELPEYYQTRTETLLLARHARVCRKVQRYISKIIGRQSQVHAGAFERPVAQ